MSVKTSGTAIIAGNLKPGETIAIDPWQLMLGKTIDASGGWDSFLDKDVSFYASLYLDGLLPIGKLITQVYSFNQINESIRDLEEDKLIRGVVKI